MVKLRYLPLWTATTPSIEVMRARLGGRAEAAEPTGELVRVSETNGVVLFANGDEVHVLTPGGVVRKARREQIASLEAPDSDELSALAADVRLFASLREGQRVRYVSASKGSGEATLIEKCRFGGLLQRDDGSVLAAGFRAIWPVEDWGGGAAVS